MNQMDSILRVRFPRLKIQTETWRPCAIVIVWITRSTISNWDYSRGGWYCTLRIWIWRAYLTRYVCRSRTPIQYDKCLKRYITSQKTSVSTSRRGLDNTFSICSWSCITSRSWLYSFSKEVRSFLCKPTRCKIHYWYQLWDEIEP